MPTPDKITLQAVCDPRAVPGENELLFKRVIKMKLLGTMTEINGDSISSIHANMAKVESKYWATSWIQESKKNFPRQ